MRSSMKGVEGTDFMMDTLRKSGKMRGMEERKVREMRDEKEKVHRISKWSHNLLRTVW